MCAARLRCMLGMGFWLLSACGSPDNSHTPLLPPRVDFAATRHDFGRVDQGTVVAYAFRLVNTGGSPLAIESLRSACGCTAAASSGNVAPGDAATIDVRFDTAAVFGFQRRTVTAYTNDAERATTVLELQGEVSLDVAADPSQLYAGRLRPGDGMGREVVVLAADTVRIESIVSGGEPLEISTSELSDGRHGRAVRVRIGAGAVPGPFRQEILVRTTSARRPMLRIPVTGRVEGAAESYEGTGR